jgi:ankyrin repeat protein
MAPHATQNTNVISLNLNHIIISDRKSTGNTLLMLAAYAGHAELVRGLIQRGADPNKINDLGQAPIAGAVFKREDEVVRVLIEAGADPRAGEPNAIASARVFGRTDLLGVLGAREGEVEDTLAVPSAQS